MHKKFLSVLITAVMVGGLVYAAMPAALAQSPPPASLLPDEDGTTLPKQGNVLSDKPDGTDDVAHLTAVAVPATDRVQWRQCPTTVTDAPFDNAELATCNIIIGEDTTPMTPGGAGGPFDPNPDEAYDITWDIGVSGVIDIAVLACVGAGEDVEAGGNCQSTVEEDIAVEDTDDPDPTDTTTGEITSICTEGATECTEAGNPDAADNFEPFPHGSPVPNDGFTIRATTSPELNAPGILHGEIFTASSAGEQDGAAAEDVACVLLSALATHATWECTFSAVGVPDDEGLSVLIDNNAGGVGNCTGVFCILDAHFAVSQDRVASEGVLTFTGAGSAPGENCDTPDTEETNLLGDDETVDFCLSDQFGDPFDGDATLELDTATVTTAGFDVCSDGGAPADHDGDGYDEHCDGTTGADGVFRGTFDNPDDDAAPANKGTQTVTGCAEGEAAGATDHGCADEDISSSVTKEWISLPSEVDLVFAGTGDPADPCNTGDSFRENQVGQEDALLVCTFDDFGNPTTTAQPDAGRLQWTIVPSGGGDRTGVEFVSPPPSETDATTAQATASITATRRSGNFICAALEDSAAGFADEDCVEKVVSPGGGGGRVASTVTIKGRFRGRVRSSLASCRNNRRVILKKVRPGPDRTVGTDRTNNRGRWRIRRPNAEGRFYAKVNRTTRCRGDRSKTVRRR